MVHFSGILSVPFRWTLDTYSCAVSTPTFGLTYLTQLIKHIASLRLRIFFKPPFFTFPCNHTVGFSREGVTHSGYRSTRPSQHIPCESAEGAGIISCPFWKLFFPLPLFFSLACPPSAVAMVAYIALLGVLLLVCLWCCTVTVGSPTLAGEATS